MKIPSRPRRERGAPEARRTPTPDSDTTRARSDAHTHGGAGLSSPVWDPLDVLAGLLFLLLFQLPGRVRCWPNQPNAAGRRARPRFPRPMRVVRYDTITTR